MKKILIASKFYYRRGGDCIYVLNLEKLLREQGHEVAIFAMDYPDNLDSEWKQYWPSQVDFSGGVKAKLSAAARTLGMGDVVKSFNRLLDDFRPDVVHLNNIHSYLSPILATIAHRRGIKVVWTLHDYKLLCPGYSCVRDGHTCELCFTDKSQVLKQRCMKGSLAASALAWLEAKRWNKATLSRNTDTFICPSQFMASKMAQGGFDHGKLVALNNFIAPEMIKRYSIDPPLDIRDDYYCYIGRLSSEKGVETLLKAASQLPYTLKVAGDGPLAEQLRQDYAHNLNIQFLGHLDAQGIHDLLRHARFSVLPSEWYENNPLGVIESLCAGTPVVGARIGGIPELITQGRGTTFTSGDLDSLKQAIRHTWIETFDYSAIQSDALARFSPQAYYAALTQIYQ